MGDLPGGLSSNQREAQGEAEPLACAADGRTNPAQASVPRGHHSPATPLQCQPSWPPLFPFTMKQPVFRVLRSLPARACLDVKLACSSCSVGQSSEH